ncbi:protein PLASTID REDOX INSENSITIVE 2, chloroplastic-like [Vicia villosa]|uniref:protein PLASTID REDOX INSENSITIVE 2, chloroplastic-like n=1 Tax=Vicia villosa TaxID=3911 RepID=UPI00273B62EA|nr:protein PLASTID REDOX INSENSITIVE 2, chloroplastic-like [Vicia villosa]
MASTSSLSLFLIPSSSSSSIPSLCLSQTTIKCKHRFSFPSLNRKLATLPFSSTKRSITRAAEYKFPDPIPEFADSETEKFKKHLLDKLSKKDVFEESVEEVVGVCTEIFNTFLHSEYGGPGTLLVDPFIDMADIVTERGLPGGPQAARSAMKWAHANVDIDWNEWTGGNSTK